MEMYPRQREYPHRRLVGRLIGESLVERYRKVLVNVSMMETGGALLREQDDCWLSSQNLLLLWRARSDANVLRRRKQYPNVRTLKTLMQVWAERQPIPNNWQRRGHIALYTRKLVARFSRFASNLDSEIKLIMFWWSRFNRCIRQAFGRADHLANPTSVTPEHSSSRRPLRRGNKSNALL